MTSFEKNSASIIQIGLALHKQGNLNLAKEIYEKILPNDPAYAESIHLLGLIYLQTGKYNDAQRLIKRSLELNPNNPQAQNNLGNLYVNINELESALNAYEKALEKNPKFAEAAINKANLLRKINRPTDALAYYDQTLNIKPDFFEALLNKGNLLIELNLYMEAIDSYKNAILINSNSSEAYYNLGLALHKIGHFNEAVTQFNKAIQIQPNYADAYNDLSTTYASLNQLENALLCITSAININSKRVDFYNNQGLILNRLSRHADAIKSFECILRLQPEQAEAYFNLGNIYKELKNFDKSFYNYDSAIQLKVDYAECYWNKALLHLLLEQYSEGWEMYEWRWNWDGFNKERRNFQQPLWLGDESLKGKTILIHCEQGLGDCIQFSRYIKNLEPLEATVIFEVYQPLINLFKSLDYPKLLIERGQPLPEFDYHCPLLSLPLALYSRQSAIPKFNTYLSSTDEKLRYWEMKLHNANENRPKIGIVWSGSTLHKNDKNRSIMLDLFIKALPDHFQYISLKKEVDNNEALLLIKSNIIDFSKEIGDFEDTAAICDQMDLIITVDTSVAHLSGALGKPTWILLPYTPDWRWSLNKETTSWYPNAKLYRQSIERSWVPVLNQIRTDLDRIKVT